MHWFISGQPRPCLPFDPYPMDTTLVQPLSLWNGYTNTPIYRHTNSTSDIYFKSTIIMLYWIIHWLFCKIFIASQKNDKQATMKYSTWFYGPLISDYNASLYQCCCCSCPWQPSGFWTCTFVAFLFSPVFTHQCIRRLWWCRSETLGTLCSLAILLRLYTRTAHQTDRTPSLVPRLQTRTRKLGSKTLYMWLISVVWIIS